MSIASGKLPSLALLAMAAALLSQQSSQAADLVGGYRERPRAATTYVSRVSQECSLLRVTEWERSRVAEVCYPPLDLRPSPGRGSSSGDSFDRSTFTVTQSGVF